jgi:hypothetical protein
MAAATLLLQPRQQHLYLKRSMLAPQSPAASDVLMHESY